VNELPRTSLQPFLGLGFLEVLVWSFQMAETSGGHGQGSVETVIACPCIPHTSHMVVDRHPSAKPTVGVVVLAEYVEFSGTAHPVDRRVQPERHEDFRVDRIPSRPPLDGRNPRGIRSSSVIGSHSIGCRSARCSRGLGGGSSRFSAGRSRASTGISNSVRWGNSKSDA